MEASSRFMPHYILRPRFLCRLACTLRIKGGMLEPIVEYFLTFYTTERLYGEYCRNDGVSIKRGQEMAGLVTVAGPVSEHASSPPVCCLFLHLPMSTTCGVRTNETHYFHCELFFSDIWESESRRVYIPTNIDFIQYYQTFKNDGGIDWVCNK